MDRVLKRSLIGTAIAIAVLLSAPAAAGASSADVRITATVPAILNATEALTAEGETVLTVRTNREGLVLVSEDASGLQVSRDIERGVSTHAVRGGWTLVEG